MKTLTLTQPWASLVAIGEKRIETRSWGTAYRGPLAIHAAKGFPKDAQEFVYSPECREAFERATGSQVSPIQLPLGKVLATCRLVHCIPTTLLRDSNPNWRSHWPSDFPYEECRREFPFGNFQPSRFAWFLSGIKPLPEPDPARGSLSLWNWDAELYWEYRQAHSPNGDATTPGFFK